MKNTKSFGFSLVELVISIAIFAILIPAIAGFLNMLTVLNDRARDTAAVNALVEHKVEALRSLSFVGLEDGTYDFTDELPDTIASPATRSAEYEVSSVSSSLKQIDVTVSYDHQGQMRTHEYRTYIGELGVGQY
jgi:prepilin-type N-terminal cleavage/methylation domain-containing protein